ncbi:MULTISPECIES: META domain-containing protein [Hymenobacter]|uniref:META domain-containing protein n=2 Tax=Hymenobacter TaxID=89966 RepID=A0ABS6WYL4_9BACT|nr:MULTISPECIES: META domain-containing protein [Hymenobacter]MBO3269143.1 META domain-containing protein [Hymenobacter defluvii]MBW3128686.1 META domain-containing protein [Hymenobacter profundi]QNE38806.1 META domain-containing protein [Hymenobacter sp. NBH84]
MRISSFFASVITAALLGSCAGREPAETTQTPTATTTPLRGTYWVLEQLGDSAVTTPENSQEIYLTLAADSSNRAEGQAGCNRFRGRFTLAANDQLSFSPLMSTKMACPRVSLETRYLNALETTTRYQLEGDTLRLLGAPAGTQVVAQFHAGEAPE